MCVGALYVILIIECCIFTSKPGPSDGFRQYTTRLFYHCESSSFLS